MAEEIKRIEVVNNPEARRFEVHLNGDLAQLGYELMENAIIFTHTEVPPAYEGRGIAAKMAKAALDYAREEGLGVVPWCPYVAAYIKRHPEYEDLLAK